MHDFEYGFGCGGIGDWGVYWGECGEGGDGEGYGVWRKMRGGFREGSGSVGNGKSGL